MRQLIIILFMAISLLSKAQQNIVIKLTNKDDKTPIIASILIKGINKGYSTDSNGIESISFPASGNYTLVTTAVGYEEKETKITIPYSSDTLAIEMEISEEEMEDVVIRS